MKTTEDYIFIKQNDAFTEGYPTPIYAISTEIEEMNMSDTYDSNGQTVSPGDAGDHIKLDTQKAVDVANKARHELDLWLDEEDEIDKIIAQAEDDCYAVCELCGQPAIKTTTGWLTRVCKDHDRDFNIGGNAL